MAEEPTCGQGLAQHAELPLLVGDLMGAVADNLGAHLPGLVPSDEDSQHEKRVYENLMTRHREAAAMLRAIGAEMAGHREMPMGDHDLRALSSGDASRRAGRDDPRRIAADLACPAAADRASSDPGRHPR